MFREVCTGLLREGRPVRFRAAGRSMHPAIRHGSFLTVVPVEASLVRTGDVVLYESASRLVAHRVLGGPVGQAGAVLLRGDGTERADAPVRPEQILGTVVRIEPPGRRFEVERVRSAIGRVVRGVLSRVAA